MASGFFRAANQRSASALNPTTRRTRSSNAPMRTSAAQPYATYPVSVMPSAATATVERRRLPCSTRDGRLLSANGVDMAGGSNDQLAAGDRHRCQHFLTQRVLRHHPKCALGGHHRRQAFTVREVDRIWRGHERGKVLSRQSPAPERLAAVGPDTG